MHKNKSQLLCITKKDSTFVPLMTETLTAGALAQLVEQWTENPCVPGSIPGGTTSKKPNQLIRLFLF